MTAIPSTRRPILVSSFASRLAEKLGIQFLPALSKVSEAPEQKTMQNSTMQARNVIGYLGAETLLPDGPVLLVDDIIHSWWTLTMAGYLLRKNGSRIAYPFILAQATGRDASW